MSASTPAEVYAEHRACGTPCDGHAGILTRFPSTRRLSRRLSGEVIKGLVFRVQLPFESELCYSSLRL